MKLNTDVNFNSKTEVNGVHFGVVERVKTSTINEPGRKEGKDWGVASDKELKEGDIHDGIVYGVSFKVFFSKISLFKNKFREFLCVSEKIQ
jgi:hypothetical protein